MTKEEDDLRRQMLDDEDSAVAEPISGKISEQTFEEALAVASPLTRDERILINWYTPEGRVIPAIIRDISSSTGLSYSLIVETALAHGFALFSEKHKDAIELVRGLDTASLGMSAKSLYFQYLNHKPVIGKNIMRERVCTDEPTSEELNRVASILNTSRAHLAGCCILTSLCSSEVYISEESKKFLREFIVEFEIHMELMQVHAIKLMEKFNEEQKK